MKEECGESVKALKLLRLLKSVLKNSMYLGKTALLWAFLCYLAHTATSNATNILVSE